MASEVFFQQLFRDIDIGDMFSDTLRCQFELASWTDVSVAFCNQCLWFPSYPLNVYIYIYMYLFGVIFIKDVYALKTPLKNIDDPISEWGSSSRLI